MNILDQLATHAKERVREAMRLTPPETVKQRALLLSIVIKRGGNSMKDRFNISHNEKKYINSQRKIYSLKKIILL